MAGLAIVALLFAGWRKNARATAQIPRSEPTIRRKWVPIAIAETAAPLYKRPSILRRIWAIVASSGLAVVIAVVLATVTAFGLAWVVTTLTDLLKS
jgi:putative effector of murein hydrolase